MESLTYSRPMSSDITAMTRFFAEQMQPTIEQWYTQEDIDWNIAEYHTENHFKKYIIDNNIYLEIVKYWWEIIGYIEARESQKDNSRIHIWWVLVDKKFQGRWIAKQLYWNLEDFVANHEYLNIVSAGVLLKNTISIQFHKSLKYEVESEDDYERVFIKDFKLK